MGVIGNLSVLITGDTSKLRKALRDAKKDANDFASVVQLRVTGAVGALRAAMGPAAAAILGVTGAIVGLKKSVNLAAEMEQTALQFEILAKSATKGKKVLEDIRKFAASTPFQFNDLAQAGRRLLAFGVAGEQVITRLRMLGDIAAASGANINEITAVFGKMKSSGVVALGDLNQLGDRGIPIFETLKSQLGKSGDELRKFVSTGQLRFEDVLKAMQSMTSQTGMFANATQRLSQTALGKWSTFKDGITESLVTVGEAFLNAFDVDAVLSGLGKMAEFIKTTVAPVVAKVFGAIASGVEGLHTFATETPEAKLKQLPTDAQEFIRRRATLRSVTISPLADRKQRIDLGPGTGVGFARALGQALDMGIGKLAEPLNKRMAEVEAQRVAAEQSRLSEAATRESVKTQAFVERMMTQAGLALTRSGLSLGRLAGGASNAVGAGLNALGIGQRQQQLAPAGFESNRAILAGTAAGQMLREQSQLKASEQLAKMQVDQQAKTNTLLSRLIEVTLTGGRSPTGQPLNAHDTHGVL